MIKSVYIHIPFCKSFCYYCDFCRLKSNSKKQTQYLTLLEKEIVNNYAGEKISTIYIGGGTPSVLTLEQLKKLMKIITHFNKSENCEITMEVNCESIDEEKLKFLYLNINRLSFGVQSFSNHLLKKLGRKHSAEEAKEKIVMAKKKGFQNISIDLMYGIGGSTLQDLKNDIHVLKQLDIPHVSFYALTVKETNEIDILNEDEQLKMYNYIQQNLKAYQQYEVSNFAKSGWESQHNLTYWHNEEYYGFGMGAVGYINGKRYQNATSFSSYILGDREVEVVNFKEQVENEFILGLRLFNGINEKSFFSKYKKKFTDFPIVLQMINENKLQLIAGNLVVNYKKIFIMNEILVELLIGLWRK